MLGRKSERIKIFIMLAFFFFGVVANANVKYSTFIDQQLKLTMQMSDANITQKKVSDLMKEQEALYEKALYTLMSKKQKYIDNAISYNSKIFSLRKIIAVNKRMGNTYAVTRDEVQIKSYRIAKNINELIRNILIALDGNSAETFEKKLNEFVALNQKKLVELTKNNYKNFLTLKGKAPVIIELKRNVQEYYALQSINNDIVEHIYKFEKQMYGLSKFSKFHIVNVVVFISSINAVHEVDRLLSTVGLSVVKLIIIAFLIFSIFFIRKLFYFLFEKYLLYNAYLQVYTQSILARTKKTIDLLIVIISLNMIAYAYNNFSISIAMSGFFNIIYTIIITYFIYIVTNIVAPINLEKFSNYTSNVKAELINVGIKIVNFFIFLIGFLFVLYFAGVNLTALLSGLGIGGFAVAFAAKDTISNFFGTIAILASDAFSQGDWVEINEKEGIVVEIGLRVTTIRTFDNALISIPNGTFASADIKNWNKRKLGRRIKMKLGVKYDSKRENIKNAIAQIREMLENHPDIATKDTKFEHFESKHGKMVKLVSKDDLEGVKRRLLVYLDEFSNSSIDILVYCFSKSVIWEDWLQTKQDVMEKIMEIFENNDLEFAFPSLSIYNETNK